MKSQHIPILFLLATPAFADTFGSGLNQFDIDFVTIGNAGNADDIHGAGYGGVGYTYRMGVNEVSERMIDAYNALSGGPTLTKDTRGLDKPATSVSWNEAARFVNWLNTSKGFSAAYKFTTGGANDNIALWTNLDAGFDAANPFRNSNAHYYLPSEDEWYKAAYYDPNKSGGAGYWDYATGSDTAPTAVAGGTTSGTAVYNGQVGPADITNAGGLSAYGTMGQNVWEWGESGFTAPNDSAGESRVLRGGAWLNSSGDLAASGRLGLSPTLEPNLVGFRVAAVPEPSAFILTLLGMISVVTRRRR
jgi:formylglycine-generating enzyme required for sulfatase activity